MATKKKDEETGPVDERPAEYEQYGVPAPGTEEPYQVGPEKLDPHAGSVAEEKDAE